MHTFSVPFKLVWVHPKQFLSTSQIQILNIIPKCSRFGTFSKDLLATIKQEFCSVGRWQDMNMYLTVSMFTYRPTSSVAH
jgi:hypothetical protein